MKKINKFSILRVTLASLLLALPVISQAGSVGWNVSVGGGYGGGWRPAAYGPGWGSGWGPGWGGNWAYRGSYYGPYATYYAPPIVYASPAVAYLPPSQPMVLASQPQPAVWYFCEVTGNYYPYTQECPSGWQIQPATPPTSNTIQRHPQH